MTRTYYPCWFRLDSRDRYLIWFTIEDIDDDIDRDGVVVDANGYIPIFVSRARLDEYARANAIPVNDQALWLHNLDTVVRWLQRRRTKWKGPTDVDCDAFLSAWNLLADVSRTIDGGFDPDHARTDKINNKLFWGTNPPVLTPEGKHYTPYWPLRERRILREVMRHGLQMFRSRIKRQ